VQFPPATRPDELLAGRRGGEVLVDEVGDVVLTPVLLGQAGPPRTGLTGLQAQLTHDAPHELGTAGHTPPRKLGVDASIAVGLVGKPECVGDQRCQLFSSLCGR